MTTPEDPFSKPGSDVPPPGYGTPPPGYGAPPPAYGGAPGFGGPPAGGMPQLADWGPRALALLIDAAIQFGLIIVVIIVASIVGAISNTLGALVGVLGYLAVFGFYIWQLVNQGNTGQTIGKKQIGIKLVREADGQPVGAGLSVARYFVHFVDSAACFVGYLWPLWDAKKQTFADKILTTLVIKV